MVGWYILIGIILFIALILIIPVGIDASFEKDLSAKLKIAFVPITLYPPRPKKPKKEKNVGLFATYFHDLGTFNALLVEPDALDDTFVFWMCPNCLLWEKHTRWSKAWRGLKNGCWTVASLCLDDEETRNLMDYLNTMLKLNWEGYKNEEED